MSERRPGNPDDLNLGAELEGFELLGEFDKSTLMRKTALAVRSHVIELRESAAMKYTKEHIPSWIGEAVTDKRNVRIAIAIGGAALAFMAARTVLGKDWDDKISRGLRSITESIEREETTPAIEQGLGALGQPPAAPQIFDELGSELSTEGEPLAPGAFGAGVAWVRRAFTRAVLPPQDNLLTQPREDRP